MVLDVFRQAGVTAKPVKCSRAKKYILYLGHVVGNGKMAVPEARITAMRDYVLPKTKKHLKSFLGGIGYHRAFIRRFADYSSLLTPATAKFAPDQVQWTEPMQQAFVSLKNSLCDHVILCVQCQSDSFVLCTDASGKGVGVLYVHRNDELLLRHSTVISSVAQKEDILQLK